MAFSCALAQGVPPSEWTPQETLIVGRYREFYGRMGLSFSDAQAALAIQSLRDQQTRLSGGMAAALTPPNSPSPREPAPAVILPGPVAPASSLPAASRDALSEEHLAAQLAGLPPKKGDLSITQRREGFVVNGRPVIDAEGRITQYGYDVFSGDITYAVETPGNTMIKVMRAGSDLPAITIATAVKNETGWSVQTVTGQRLAGPALSMLPRGLLVARPGATFRYEPGQGVRNIAVPGGYVLTPIQRGNVGATGYLLLEKENADGGGNDVTQIFSVFKAMGSTLGLNKKEDYALYNIDTGATFPLNISAEGKNVTALSDCYRRKPNSMINNCYRAQSFEGLYEPSGERNIRHYYWRAQWLKTPQGPIAVTMENGSKDVFIMDLTTGKKVVAFHRGLGINGVDVTQKPDGTVQIDVRLAFDRQSIPDALAFLATSPVVAPDDASPEKKP